MKTQIALLYASWGWGHKKAALALQEAFAEQNISADAFDLLDFLPTPLSKIYSSGYSSLVRYGRFIWSWIYETTNNGRTTYSPAKSLWQGWQFRKLKQRLASGEYTHIVSTHFLTSALLADWKEEQWWKSVSGSVVTDYHAHRYWMRRGIDAYFVPSDEVRSEMISGGIETSRVWATGIPISLNFSNSSGISRSQLRNELGLPIDEKLVLVLSSGLSLPRTAILVRNLRETPGKIRFLVSSGKDAPDQHQVNNLRNGDDRIQIFGISDRMPDLMKTADLLVSKPGGIVISESLAIGLPQIILPPIPGQEEANAAFLLRHKAGISTDLQNGNLKGVLEDVLSSSEKLTSMKQAATSTGKPEAARTIARLMLNQKK